MHEVVEGELPSSAVLQPLLANLVAANVKLPDLGWDALEILGLIDEDEARLAFLVGCKLGKSLLNEIISGNRIAGYELRDLG